MTIIFIKLRLLTNATNITVHFYAIPDKLKKILRISTVKFNKEVIRQMVLILW